jgi:two-component system, OmpR family, sensor histidine kinase KdpD
MRWSLSQDAAASQLLPANGDLAAEHRGDWLMEGLGLPLQQSFLHLTAGGLFRRFAIGLLLAASAMVIAAAGFLLRVNLSTAGSLELLLVLLVALRLGFFQATVVSITAFLALNFLFTAPVFTFVVADPQNWVSLFTFEATALLVSGLSTKVRLHAAQAEEQRARAVKLYELSRAVLLIDQRGSTSDQLSGLISEMFDVKDVQFWLVHDTTELPPETEATQRNQQAYKTYLEEKDNDDLIACCSQRVLRLGTNIMGGMTMRRWKIDPFAADAVASIAAITFARTRAIQLENRAEVERDAERLRTAVLDGLAHGFKTPLTAIQTASSGLLAIDCLSATQLELVSIIDERATMLSQLTTSLLQTAALEAKEIRLRRSNSSIAGLLQKVVRQQEEEVRARIEIAIPEKLRNDQLDAPMIELALQQLVDNAVKYSAIGSPIPIMIRQIPSETAVVVQNATIAGSSIRMEERTRIFERFYRGADAVHGPSGTGLGLSIVKKIAEAHGGRVWVECSDDTTRFTFSIQRYEKEKNG